jgi:hypothetical protein
MESIFGGGIEFESKDQFDKYIETIDKPSALKIIDLSIDFGLKSGLYSLEESYALYKCLNKLKENEI